MTEEQTVPETPTPEPSPQARTTVISTGDGDTLRVEQNGQSVTLRITDSTAIAMELAARGSARAPFIISRKSEMGEMLSLLGLLSSGKMGSSGLPIAQRRDRSVR